MSSVWINCLPVQCLTPEKNQISPPLRNDRFSSILLSDCSKTSWGALDHTHWNQYALSMDAHQMQRIIIAKNYYYIIINNYY